MNNIVFDCFECKQDVKTSLIRNEKSKENVICSCGCKYKVVSFKKGIVNIYRTNG